MLREHQDELGVIISDQRMPGMQGVQLLEQARKLQPRIIRMLATAYTDMEAAVAELQKRRGDIVRVKDDDSNVRIWIDDEVAPPREDAR